MTKTLDPAVRPVPILQIINLLFGLFLFMWEWPLGFLAGTALHRSLELRLVVLPLAALSAALIYQGTNPAIYMLVGIVVYFWAYSEGEVCTPLQARAPARRTNSSCLTDHLRQAMDAAATRRPPYRSEPRVGHAGELPSQIRHIHLFRLSPQSPSAAFDGGWRGSYILPAQRHFLDVHATYYPLHRF